MASHGDGTGGAKRALFDRIPPHPALPGLTPRVAEFFVQRSV
jgi:hypothetical protein